MSKEQITSPLASSDRPSEPELGPPDEYGFLRSDDGTPLYFESRGRGPTLLLCYGLVCRREHWRHQIAFFQKHYRIVLFDYRGHQKSPAPVNDKHLTVDWCARDAQAVVHRLGLESFAAFGHSLGVPIVAELAVREPKRMKAAVFICGAMNNPFEQMFFTDKVDKVFEWTARAYDWFPTVSNELWKRMTATNPVTYFLTSQLGFNPVTSEKEDVLSYMQGVQQTHPQVFYTLLQDYRLKDRRDLLPKIHTPTLVVAGDEDCVTPFPVQEEIVRLLPNAEMDRILEGSHNAHIDFPVQVNASILDFLIKNGFGPQMSRSETV
jgi:pimeloyl-ACP methyl ester carboxylesterase